METKKVLAIILTAGLILSSSFCVYAEPEDTGSRSDAVESVSSADDTASASGSVSSESSLSALSEEDGPNGTDSENSVESTAEQQIQAAAEAETAVSQNPEISIADVSGDEKQYRITLTGIEGNEEFEGASYVAAVWSDEKGQDDLHWNPMTVNTDGSASVTINIKDYNSPGTYSVHVYRNDRGMQFLSSQTLNISTVSAGSITTEETDQSKGTCRVRISGVSCTSGVTEVVVPVWCSADQSDLHWYTAQKDADGSWYTDISIASHDYHTGTYQIHVYATSGNGFQNFVGQTQIDFEGAEPQIEVSVGTCGVNVTASDLRISEKIRNVAVAVWSDTDGQDDLKWTELDWDAKALTASGTVYPSEYKHLGLFNAHVYATGISGKMYLMGETTFNVESVGGMITDVSGDEKQFEIRLTGIGTDDASYVAAVWSDEKGQDDLRWNPLKKNADGSASVTINIEEYNSPGTYNVHIYRNDGAMHFISAQTLNISSVGAESVTAEDADQSKGTCHVRISGVSCPSGVSQVVVPVWCSADQSDLHWYTAKKESDGSWYTDIDIANHAYHAGTYQIHVYGISGNGFQNFIGQTQIAFEGIPTQLEASLGTGTVSIKASNLAVSEKIKNVAVAVWSDTDGQDDLKWTELDWNAGTLTASGIVYPSEYKHLGLFNAHVYATGVSGKMYFMGETTFTIEAPSKAEITTSGEDSTGAGGLSDGTFRVSISLDQAAYVKSVTVPVWCADDQSDLFWYKASEQADGTYTVTVNMKNHENHTGEYKIHVYATLFDDSFHFLGNTVTTFAPENYMTISSVSGKRTVSYHTSSSLSVVSAAVWSDENGQDDLVWIPMTESGNTWTVTVDGSDFESSGIYYVHLYTEDSVFLGSGSFSFSDSEVNSTWKWPCPSSRYISSYFGPREAPTAGASTYHQGLDIAASAGSSIVAVAAGTVTDKGYDSTRGYYVFVTLNNGIVTLSQHMCQPAIVSVGEKVSAGQVIGYVGSTGVATGAHLHFSVIVNGNYVDPLPYLANS